jgi:hypothetical protein
VAEPREAPDAGASHHGKQALRTFVARVVPGDWDAVARVDAAAAEVFSALEQAGVDALLLKGRGLRTLLYEPGELWGYGDVDVLVAPSGVDAAERILAELGYSSEGLGRGIDDVGGVMHGQPWSRAVRDVLDQTMVDLHWRLPGSRASAAVAWQALTARRTWVEVGGRSVAALDRCGQALHLAIHAAQHGPTLGLGKVLDELSLALERWPADVWRCAAGLARQLDAEQAFAAGLRLLPQGTTLASELALAPTAELDWLITHREVRPRGTVHLHALGELDGVAARLQILRGLLLPSRTWIAREHRWTRSRGPLIVAAYALHFVQLPGWAARAWWYRARARRAGRL